MATTNPSSRRRQNPRRSREQRRREEERDAVADVTVALPNASPPAAAQAPMSIRFYLVEIKFSSSC